MHSHCGKNIGSNTRPRNECRVPACPLSLSRARHCSAACCLCVPVVLRDQKLPTDEVAVGGRSDCQCHRPPALKESAFYVCTILPSTWHTSACWTPFVGTGHVSKMSVLTWVLELHGHYRPLSSTPMPLALSEVLSYLGKLVSNGTAFVCKPPGQVKSLLQSWGNACH